MRPLPLVGVDLAVQPVTLAMHRISIKIYSGTQTITLVQHFQRKEMRHTNHEPDY
jgi:hypothetical protein